MSENGDDAHVDTVMALRPRFGSHRELLNHLFHNRGIEITLVKQLVHANNVSMLTEIVCFILDRPGYPEHIQQLETGSRCSELATINYLGVNHGYRVLDDQYNILFYLLSMSKPPEMIDFFRVLRSSNEWTSATFRTAIETSPLHEYVRFVKNTLIQVTPSRRHFFTLAYAVNLAFAGTDDNLSRWLHTEIADSNIFVINPTITPETHYQSIEHIFNEIFRNGIGGVNVALYKTLLGADAAVLRTYPEDNAKLITDLRENCTTIPLAVRSAVVRYETFALSYLSIYSNDYEIKQMDKELSKADTTAERREEITKMKAAFALLKTDYTELFAYMIERFGIDLCSVNEIVAVYLCAKIYEDKATQTMMTKMAGIDDTNMWSYSHQIRLRFVKDVSLLNDLPDTTKASDQMSRSMLEFFIRRNLITAAQWVIDDQQKPLQDLSGQSNFLSLTASTAVAHPSTIQWLIKQKAKLYSNSKNGTKLNVFVCCLFSLGSPESRLAMMKESFEFVQRNPAFKPEVSVEEFFEGVKMSWTSAMWDQDDTTMRIPLLRFVLDNLINKPAWEKLRTTPDRYLRHISDALPPEAFMLSDFTMYSQSCIDNFHNEMLEFFKLILPKEVAPYVCEERLFKRILQHPLTTKNIELLKYLLSFESKIEMSDFIGLAQTSASSFDYRDLFHIPSQLFSISSSDSETSMAVRQFQVQPFHLTTCERVFGELLDFDYCDHKVLLENNLNPDQPTPPELKPFIEGAAEKAGVRQIEWQAFGPERTEGDPDIAVVGGDANEVDGELEPYTDEANDESYFEKDEFQNGITFLLSLFESNNQIENPQLRSPFLTMLELMYDRCGSAGGDSFDTDPAIEFGRLWLDLSNASIPIVTANHVLWTIIRQLFPNRAVDFSVTSQFLAATSTCTFFNKRVWTDDYMLDFLIEIVGATDHKQIAELHDKYQAYLNANPNSAAYIAQRQPGFAVSRQLPIVTEEVLPTNLVWNIQQFIFTQLPFSYNNMAESLVLSLALSITVGYISIVGSQKHQAQQRYMKEATAAQKRGQPLPPMPYTFVSPQMFLDSARIFTTLFQQIKWLPQILLKLFLAQFEITNVSLYGDFFDLFISTGGKILDEDAKCRLPPASYPIMIPPEKADKFFGYFEFVLVSHGIDLEHIQSCVETIMKESQQTIEEFENGQGSGVSATANPTSQAFRRPEGPSHKEKAAGSSASSYILPVILGVGAALAGLAGFLYYTTQEGDDDVAPEQPQQQRRAKR